MTTIANQDLMKQTATYWPPLAADGFGGIGFDSPVSVPCRWQDRSELYLDRDGKETKSAAVVYPDRILERGGWLYLGESLAASPKSVEGAHEIKQIRQTPDMQNVFLEVKAWL